MSSASVTPVASTKPKVRKWVTRNQGISTNQISPLVRSVGEPAPYSVLNGVPIGSDMSMTPEEYMSFIEDRISEIGAKISEIGDKKLHQ